jgi:hypothetical protein
MVSHFGVISICYVLIFSLKKDTKLLSEQRPSISFEFCAENIICFVSEYGHGAQSRIEYAPPLQRITAFVCMMDPRCAQSFSNMHSYDVHRYHARNVGTLCASLTMRGEIVATRRAGLTTAVIKRPKASNAHDAFMLMTAELPELF